MENILDGKLYKNRCFGKFMPNLIFLHTEPMSDIGVVISHEFIYNVAFIAGLTQRNKYITHREAKIEPIFYGEFSHIANRDEAKSLLKDKLRLYFKLNNIKLIKFIFSFKRRKGIVTNSLWQKITTGYGDKFSIEYLPVTIEDDKKKYTLKIDKVNYTHMFIRVKYMEQDFRELLLTYGICLTEESIYRRFTKTIDRDGYLSLYVLRDKEITIFNKG